MVAYLLRRFIQMVFLFIVFFALSWFVLQAIPGNTIENRLLSNPNFPPERIAAELDRFGLNDPLPVQFWNYTTNFFQGDLGVSWTQFPRPVSELIAQRLPRTLVLFVTALATQYFVGFQAGKYLAWRRNQRGEMVITIAGVGLFTIFYPWFGLMMILLFSVRLGLLPTGGFVREEVMRDSLYTANFVFGRMFLSAAMAIGIIVAARWYASRLDKPTHRRSVKATGLVLAAVAFTLYWRSADFLPIAKDIGHHLILPVGVLTLVGFAGTMLLTRASMLETMKEDFVMTARAKGLSESAVRDRHAARTALLPVSTSLVLAIATVIDGGILTETIFSWPGMGELLFSSVVSEDIPVAVAAFSFTGILALVGHFAADVFYGLLDPRIRVSSQG